MPPHDERAHLRCCESRVVFAYSSIGLKWLTAAFSSGIPAIAVLVWLFFVPAAGPCNGNTGVHMSGDPTELTGDLSTPRLAQDGCWWTRNSVKEQEALEAFAALTDWQTAIESRPLIYDVANSSIWDRIHHRLFSREERLIPPADELGGGGGCGCTKESLISYYWRNFTFWLSYYDWSRYLLWSFVAFSAGAFVGRKYRTIVASTDATRVQALGRWLDGEKGEKRFGTLWRDYQDERGALAAVGDPASLRREDRRFVFDLTIMAILTSLNRVAAFLGALALTRR